MKRIAMVSMMALVAGQVFAQDAAAEAPAPEKNRIIDIDIVGGGVSTTFGYDLDQLSSGFTTEVYFDEVDLGVNIESSSTESVYGYLAFKGVEVNIGNRMTAAGGEGEGNHLLQLYIDDIDAKIQFGDMYIELFDIPELNVDYAGSGFKYHGYTPVSSDAANVRTYGALTNKFINTPHLFTPSLGASMNPTGLTFGFSQEKLLSTSLKLVSNNPWNKTNNPVVYARTDANGVAMTGLKAENFKNAYGLDFNMDITAVENLTLSFGAAVDDLGVATMEFHGDDYSNNIAFADSRGLRVALGNPTVKKGITFTDMDYAFGLSAEYALALDDVMTFVPVLGVDYTYHQGQFGADQAVATGTNELAYIEEVTQISVGAGLNLNWGPMADEQSATMMFEQDEITPGFGLGAKFVQDLGNARNGSDFDTWYKSANTAANAVATGTSPDLDDDRKYESEVLKAGRLHLSIATYEPRDGGLVEGLGWALGLEWKDVLSPTTNPDSKVPGNTANKFQIVERLQGEDRHNATSINFSIDYEINDVMRTGSEIRPYFGFYYEKDMSTYEELTIAGKKYAPNYDKFYAQLGVDFNKIFDHVSIRLNWTSNDMILSDAEQAEIGGLNYGDTVARTLVSGSEAELAKFGRFTVMTRVSF